MNKFLNGLVDATNIGYTENGAIKRNTTKSALLDFFAMGGAMRQRDASDIITMFRKALAENETYALKCLFYFRDIRNYGQGERRLFRICLRDLALHNTDAARRNMQYIPMFGRYDDFYALMDTPLEAEAFAMMKEQLAVDLKSETPSLLAKWLKSENTSSKETRKLAAKTRIAFGMTHKQYRKVLAHLRSKINVLEKLMSENHWDKIEFDKIPSKAGLIYKHAFINHDDERAKLNIQTYEDFLRSKESKVNAKTLNPVEIAREIFNSRPDRVTEMQRLAWDKYWAGLKDYYNGRQENGIAVCDVSGSMYGEPMEAAVSMSAYIAERGKGPFANHFITFSSNPQLVSFDGVDIYDKFRRASRADWGMNTNVKAVFDLLLSTAISNKCLAEEIPERIYIFSDMEFDSCACVGPVSYFNESANKITTAQANTLFEEVKVEWAKYGYKLPNVVFWNLRAAQENIPAIGEGFSYISGFSMAGLEAVLSGKQGYDMMMEILNKEVYDVIH